MTETDMVVSCPKCGSENTVAMELREELPGVTSLLATLTPVLDRYSFDGYVKCVCGKRVVVTLTVIAG